MEGSRIRRTSLTTLVVFATLTVSSTRAEDAQIGKTRPYYNPLPMVTTAGGRSVGSTEAHAW
jgi:hypothetical protein